MKKKNNYSLLARVSFKQFLVEVWEKRSNYELAVYELEPVWFVVIANSCQGWLTSCNQAGNSLGCRRQASGPVGLASYKKRKETQAEK